MIINNLSFSYGDKKIFDNFNLSFDDRYVCLMGESGIGKTTLLKLMAGLLKPDKGEIISDFSKASFLFQEDRLLKWFDVRRNMMLVSEDEDKANKLLEELEIDKNLKISELSGGMARRVSLIRTLVYESDVLLLDEPFKGMDEKLINKVGKILLNENKPIIMTSHSTYETSVINARIIEI